MSEEVEKIDTDVEKPVEPVLTEEEKKEQADVERLQTVIKGFVDQLLASDFSVHVLGYSQDLFDNWLRIKTAKTEQHEELVKAIAKLNDDFKKIVVKDLKPLHENAEKSGVRVEA